MRIAVVGAGAMGGSYGGLLSLAGEDVSLVDARSDHVEAIRSGGLRVSGVFGEHLVRMPAAGSPEGLEPADGGWADLVIVFTDSNATREAARAAGSPARPGRLRDHLPERDRERRDAARGAGGGAGCSAVPACAAPSSKPPATW